MPSKSMSPMHMPPKIGDASLKFGPDWLRALSSDGGNNTGGGDAGGRGGMPPGGGWGGGLAQHISNMQRDYSATVIQHHSAAFQHQSHNSQKRDTKDFQQLSSSNNVHRFKPSEFRYSREEMLSLYDKNLGAPAYLQTFGTLLTEKMQPPLAFSQPSEEEIKIWHTPQPESSRQGGVGPIPMGRGSYSVRGRGSGIERGRGRGRGGYYGRPHEDEERSFIRPRTFERSQSAHERVWAERNGNVGGPPGTEEAGARGGSWRTREPYSGGGRRHDDDDGWRSNKPRWRREDEEDSPRSGSGRRLHKSWSEDDAHDNLPEWARDNPCEESGTFDASGAFHGEERSKSKDSDCLRDGDGNSRSSAESECYGSHNDKVQKRTPDRIESTKSVIPPVLEEEIELQSEKERYMTSVNNVEHSDKMPTNSDVFIPNQLKDKSIRGERTLESLKSPTINQNHLQQVLEESRPDAHELLTSKYAGSLRDIESNRSRTTSLSKNSEDDPYRSMTEEAANLVAKLIEEDISGARGSSLTGHSNKVPNSSSLDAISKVGNNATGSGNTGIPTDELASNNATLHKNIPVSGNVPTVSNHSPSMNVWLYRDPQGSVQGPFPTHEMALWYSQGYFTANLLLRRECDKVFVTLLEMGRLYNRNPFSIHHESPPPPPILEPIGGSALDLHLNDGNGPHFQRQQQLLHQQNIIREHQQHPQQYVMSGLNPGAAREDEAWQGTRAQNQPQKHSRNTGNVVPLSPDPVQTQLLINFAKSQGINVDVNSPNPIEHLQALFQRQNQLKNLGGDVPGSVPQQQSSTSDVFNPMMHSQVNPQIDVRKSPVNAHDPIQSLFQQLTNMTNTQQQQPSHPQQHKIHPGNNSEIINHWGGSHSQVPVQQQAPWMSQPWDMNEQLLKQQKLHDEELKRRQKEEEEKERKRQAEEEQRKLLEEQKKREMEEQERKMREEEALKQQEAERARQKEIARQKELMLQQQRQMEQQRLLEQQRLEQQRQLELQRELEERERKVREEEALKQQEAERARQQEILIQQQQRQMEQQRLIEQQRLEQQRQLEQKLRMEEQQQRERQEQAKLQEQQRFSWNANAAQQSTNSNKARTLLEIQQEEALKQEQEEVIRQQMLKKQMQQEQLRQQQQQSQGKGGMNLKWAQGASTQQKVKSLTEIQAEEQAKLAKQKEKEREQRAMIQHHNKQQQAWSANLTWANRASLNAPPTTNKTNGGAWDEQPSVQMATPKLSYQSAASSKLNQTVQSPTSNNQGHQISSSGKRARDAEEFMKLFQVSNQDHNSGNMKQSANQDEFTKWCFESLQAMGGNVDIPTFVGFLKEVESPYEVSDYVRSYLGDAREAREFGREFLERRSKWKNARRGRDDGEASEDNLCLPASAVNPNQNDFQEVKGKGKKGKKGKMQKVDARNLGFNVTAPTRLNTSKGEFDEGTD